MRRRDLFRTSVSAALGMGLASSTVRAGMPDASLSGATSRIAVASSRAAAENAKDLEDALAIDTLGFAAPGDGGGGRYLRTLSMVRGAFATRAGSTFAPDMSEPVSVGIFGARGGDPTHDDYPGILEAIAAALEAGGGVLTLATGRRYTLSDTLVIDPTRITLIGHGSTLSFATKEFVDPEDAPERIPDPGVTSWHSEAAPWSAETLVTYRTRLTLAIGRYRGRVAVAAPAGSEPPRLSFTLTPRNAKVPTFWQETHVSRSAAQGEQRDDEMVWTFEIDARGTDLDLAVTLAKGTAPRLVSLKPLPDNACMRITTPVGAPLRLTIQNELRGFRVSGRYDQEDFVDGIVFDTPLEEGQLGQNSRCQIFNIDVADGIGRGLVFGRQAYLVNLFGSRIIGKRTAIDTISEPMSHDAGENIVIMGGNIGGGEVAVSNRGMSLRFISTSLNFTRQWYRGNGEALFVAAWMESKAFGPTDAAAPKFEEGQYRIDVTGGHVRIDGGYLQLGGAPDGPTYAEAVFRVAAGASLTLDGVAGYNWRSRSDVWAVGEGRVFCRNLVTGLHDAIPAIVKRDSTHNRMVPTTAGASPLQASGVWLGSSHSDAVAMARDLVAFVPAIRFHGRVSRGNPAVEIEQPTPGLEPGLALKGANLPVDAQIISVEEKRIVMSHAADTDGLIEVAASRPPTGRLRLEPGLDVAGHELTGLVVVKEGIGRGTPGEICVAIPVGPGESVGIEFFWLPPEGRREPFDLFCQLSFAALAQHDPDRPPLIRSRVSLTNASDRSEPDSTGWRRMVLRSPCGNGGCAPEWATDAVLTLQVIALSEGERLGIAGIHANGL